MRRTLAVSVFLLITLSCAPFSSMLRPGSLCIRGWEGDGQFIKTIIAAQSATSRDLPECFSLTYDAGARQGLWMALKAIEILINTSSDNLLNADDAARGDADGIYSRQVATVAADGTVQIERDTTTPPRLVYDPEHPDAISAGPQKGYVRYPNVNARQELKTLIRLYTLHNSVAYVLMRLDPGVVIVEKNTASLQEIRLSQLPGSLTHPEILHQ